MFTQWNRTWWHLGTALWIYSRTQSPEGQSRAHRNTVCFFNVEFIDGFLFYFFKFWLCLHHFILPPVESTQYHFLVKCISEENTDIGSLLLYSSHCAGGRLQGFTMLSKWFTVEPQPSLWPRPKEVNNTRNRVRYEPEYVTANQKWSIRVRFTAMAVWPR